ncbi:MAG: hypothetical protein KF817_03005 [Phycisphaeraceae bacterium]|nr:hypothetical protein [Phycisphaeraceae bacterium]
MRSQVTLRSVTCRVCLPFSFEPRDVPSAAAEVDGGPAPTFGSKSLPIGESGLAWTREQLGGAKNRGRSYLKKLIPTVVDAVFGGADGAADRADHLSPGYFRLRPEVVDRLLPQGTVLIGLKNNRAAHDTGFKPAKRHPLELFLSSFGFGVISVIVECTPGAGDEVDPGAEDDPWPDHIRRPLYAAANTGASLHMRVGLTRADQWPPGLLAVADASMPEKGVRWLRLVDLLRVLIPIHCQPLGLRLASTSPSLPAASDPPPSSWKVIGGELALHTVVRLATRAGSRFGEDQMLHAFSRRLARNLSIVPSPEHPGITDGHTGVRLCELTTHHLAAVGAAGVHVILDQAHDCHRDSHADDDQTSDGDGFNTGRLHSATDGYFVPFLLALHQRWHSETTLARARMILDRIRTDGGRDLDGVTDEVMRLTRDSLDFSVAGDLATVSANQNFNAWYDACRASLRSREGLERIRDGLRDLSNALSSARASALARSLHENVEATRVAQQEIVETQRKLEFVEVILVTIYVAKLSYILFYAVDRGGLHWGLLLLCIAVGIVGALWLLLGGEHGSDQHAATSVRYRRRVSVLFAIILVPIVGSIGLWMFGPSKGAPVVPETKRPVEPASPVDRPDEAAPSQPSSRTEELTSPIERG